MLVCAPSNKAVDQLALRLQRADPALRLLRYGAGVEQRADGALAGMAVQQLASLRVEELEQVGVAHDAMHDAMRGVAHPVVHAVVHPATHAPCNARPATHAPCNRACRTACHIA